MIRPRLRRAAAAAVLACALALAAPALAAARERPAAGRGRLGTTLEWIAHLWRGEGEPAGPTGAISFPGKNGPAGDPDGSPQGETPPAAATNGGSGSDADGQPK
jgi:hypothetical protein